MNVDSTSKNNGITDPSELAEVDELLLCVTSSIDSGNYTKAITDFEQVLNKAHTIFGDTDELCEINRKVNEIQDILKQLEK